MISSPKAVVHLNPSCAWAHLPPDLHNLPIQSQVHMYAKQALRDIFSASSECLDQRVDCRAAGSRFVYLHGHFSCARFHKHCFAEDLLKRIPLFPCLSWRVFKGRRSIWPFRQAWQMPSWNPKTAYCMSCQLVWRILRHDYSSRWSIFLKPRQGILCWLHLQGTTWNPKQASLALSPPDCRSMRLWDCVGGDLEAKYTKCQHHIYD